MFGSLVPWRERSLFPTPEPFAPFLTRLGGEMENMVEQFWGTDGGWLTPKSAFVPKIDFVESGMINSGS